MEPWGTPHTSLSLLEFWLLIETYCSLLKR